MQDFFTICILSRADMESLGYKLDDLSDNEMEEIASQMRDMYYKNSFWKDLKASLKYCGKEKPFDKTEE